MDEQLLLSHKFDFVSHELLVGKLGITEIGWADFDDITFDRNFTGTIKLATMTMHNNCNKNINCTL